MQDHRRQRRQAVKKRHRVRIYGQTQDEDCRSCQKIIQQHSAMEWKDFTD